MGQLVTKPIPILSEDVSTPGFKYIGTTTTLTSNSFTPPAMSLVVVMASWDFTSVASTAGLITVSSSPSVTFTNLTQSQNTTQDGTYTGIFVHYFVTSPGAMTVTTTMGNGNGGGGHFQDIRVVNGASANQNGAVTSAAIHTTTVFNLSITPTQQNSIVYGMGANGDNNNALTVVSGWANINIENDTTNSVYQASGKKSGVAQVAQSVGWTTAASQSGGVSFAEILHA